MSTMREPNPSYTALANGDIDALLAHTRSQFGDMVMTADPAAAASPPAAPPAPGTGTLTIPATVDPRTGDVAPTATPANDPAGVWSGDVQPAPGVHTVPAPTQTAPGSAPPVGQPYIEIEGQRYFTQDYLEQARRDERDKMHQRLESVEQLLQRQEAERQENEKRIREEAEQQAREAEAARLAGLSTEDRIVELQRTWEERWQQRDQQDAQRTAIEEQERRYNDLNNYRARRIAEESDLIHPTLVDLVASPETGAASEQQIEESIAALKAKTDAIVGTVRQAEVEQRRVMPGVAPTGQPNVGPMDQTSGYQSITPADIAAMDPATYAKNRATLMEAMRHKVASQGLYAP